MRKCAYCNADIPDGEFICPACGEPVQLVPDYETIESREQESELRRKEEEERQLEAARLAARREEERLQETRRARKRRLAIAGFAAVAVLLLIVIVLVLNSRKKAGSFEYQYNLAMQAFQSQDLAGALEHVQNALEIQPDNPDAGLLLGMIYEEMDSPEKAIETYEKVIKTNPDYEKAYDRLIPLYVQNGEYEKLQKLIEECQNQKIHDKFADYLVYDVTFSLDPGIYHEEKELELKSEGKGTIHYSLDGTEPSESSLMYRSAIPLEEGETVVKARYFSPQHIPGDTVEGSFTVQMEKPKAPVITPPSGTYSSLEPVKITVEVPTGYTAYYSFDVRADKNSSRYTEPVTMPEGDHIFYAVLVDDRGKEGDVASATYVYKKTPPTVTPTPRSETPQSVFVPDATETPTPTPEETSTPTPTPTPTPTAEPTSAPTETPAPAPTETPTAEPTKEPSSDSGDEKDQDSDSQDESDQEEGENAGAQNR